ncbi:MAG: carbohydrate ABC transporter permease [Planctomycetota bacterium]
MSQRGRRERAEERAGWLWVSPFVIGVVVFLAVPVALAVYTSFTDYALLEPPLWIGAEHYAELGEDPVFWRSVRNTALYAVGAVALNTLVALGLALLLERPVRGRELVRAIVFAPVLVPIVAASIGWMWLYHPEHGLIADAVAALGMPRPDLLGDARTALASLVVMGAWIVGSQVVVLTAALRGVSRSQLEAATLDGADAGWRFRAVVLPSIGPALLFNVVVSIIWAAQVFATPLVMTRGGPAGATQVYAMYVFQNAFQYGRMGYASALAWIQFLVVCVLTAIVLRLGRRYMETA